MKNPQVMIQRLMNSQQMMNNPMISNAMQMYQQGNIAGLKTMAENICKQKGMDLEQVRTSILNQFR